MNVSIGHHMVWVLCKYNFFFIGFHNISIQIKYENVLRNYNAPSMTRFSFFLFVYICWMKKIKLHFIFIFWFCCCCIFNISSDILYWVYEIFNIFMHLWRVKKNREWKVFYNISVNKININSNNWKN